MTRYGYIWNEEGNKWDQELQTWVADSKTTCIAASLEDKQTCVTYNRQGNPEGWKPSSRITYLYYTDQTLQRKRLEVWNPEIAEWVTSLDFYYLYDRYGREAEWLSFGWDRATGERLRTGRQLHTYDTYGNRVETLRFGWNKETAEWYLSGKMIEYWTDRVKSNRDEIGLNEIKVYPNPFEVNAIIELGDYQNTRQIELVDMVGRKVRILEEINQPTLTLDRGNLRSGLYLLKVHTTTETITLRVIIK